MITILTGAVNSGKTTRLMSLYKKEKQGDGIALPKIHVKGQYVGQDILRLSTGASVPFSRVLPHLPKGWDEGERYQNYSFSLGGITFGRAVLGEMIKSPVNPVFIDEIGPLELLGEGFYSVFYTLLSCQKDMVVTVRDSCLVGFLTKFELCDYRLYV